MSAGSPTFTARRVAALSLISLCLAACNSNNSSAPAPVSSVGGSASSNSAGASAGTGGGMIMPPSNISTQSRPAPVQPAPVQPQISQPRQAQVIPEQPVETQNGRIVYNRKYGNIPKGSYTGGSTYTVKRGDTLFYIAWITGNDFRDLAQRNHIEAPYGLNVGQTLQVGNASGTPITGGNAITQADASAQGIVSKPAQNTSTVVASKPTIIYSEDSGEQSANKMLPGNVSSGAVVAPSTAPAVSTPEPTVSSTTNSAPVATAEGRVVYAGSALRGYGNLIIIKHNDDYLSAYAHNDTMLVREQQEVKAGQKIATMGSSGTSSTRLHFEIRYKGKSVNPLRYLPQR